MAEARRLMRMGLLAIVVGVVSAVTVAARAADENRPAAGVRFVFMEADKETGAGGPPLYRRVDDAARVATMARWLENDSARWAVDLYRRARLIAAARHKSAEQPADYFVALVPDGNNAAVGFRLRGDKGIESFPHAAYIQLGPEEWRFSTTLLHETGHVVLSILAAGEIPRRELAAIPHTVAALTDRGTAFDEGFAIHLETLAAHLSSEPEMRRAYRHERFLFGPVYKMRGGFYDHSRDLLSFAQTVARYAEVRDNNFAFASAFRGPDYLRVQMEKARDFANLRDADQLLQSEGFVGSLFFALLMRGEGTPPVETIRGREDRVLAALAETLASPSLSAESPILLEFVATYLRLNRGEAAEIIDLVLDLSHGVFVDAEAPALWREHYLAALRLDLPGLSRERIDAARERWRAAVTSDPQVLTSRLGPQLRCEVPGRTVRLVGLGDERVVSFDVNTVEEGIIRLVPGITEGEVASWLAQRGRTPFTSREEFATRSGLAEATLSKLKIEAPGGKGPR